MQIRRVPYLCGVHFELANNLDRDLGVLSSVVSGAVDIAECAITHLFDQSVTIESRVPREFALALTLFGNDTLEH